ncbi:MAG: DUF3575 domain-containing protein [Parabacteroides gordonii]|nr:DUF3575 domain-containing protein [Parabacteroides gordonii]
MKQLFTLFFLWAVTCIPSQAQDIAVKTNLLYDATTSMNLGLEFGLAEKWTLDVSGNYNPWEFSDNRQLKHAMLQPEARYWFCEKFNRHFVGFHLHGAIYNAGKLNMPFDIGEDGIEQHRYKGWLAGAGVSYGYHWILGKRWSLEANIGIGYAYLGYDGYRICEDCKEKTGHENKHYFGPTKAALSIIYIIK